MRSSISKALFVVAVAVAALVALVPGSVVPQANVAEAQAVAENRIMVIYSDLTAFKADWNQIRQLPNNKTVLQIRILVQFSDPDIAGPDELIFNSHEMYYAYGRRRIVTVGQQDVVMNLQSEASFVTSSIGWPFLSQDITADVPQELRAMRMDRADLVFTGHDVSDPNLDDLVDQAGDIKASDVELLP